MPNIWDDQNSFLLFQRISYSDQNMFQQFEKLILTTLINLTMSQKTGQDLVRKSRQDTWQIVWRNTMYVLMANLVYCIPGFLSFKDLALNKGYHFVRAQAWWWMLTAFVVYGSIKYTYYYLIEDFAFSIVHPKYQDDERIYRRRAIQKLSFDFFFYSNSSFLAYFWFGSQNWFPSYLGGDGECQNIFNNYPDWPNEDIAYRIQTFYMLQLGVHTFSMFQIIFIRRKTYRKYYEFLLHHFIANTLIIFSLLTNTLSVGVVILFLNDISDMTADIVRGYVETKYRHRVVDISLFLLTAVNWFYMRMIVYPFCAIYQIYMSLPTPTNEWGSIWFQQIFIIVLNCILVLMNCYWWTYLMISGIGIAKGKAAMDTHDVKKTT